ncbi:MAG TPA: hypothetical protein VFP95_05120 [Gammaproteobacteria bacterium]|nr:hypothetical protein [Gammaproteobacteria bacterium]
MSIELHLTIPQINVALGEIGVDEAADRLSALQKLAGYANSQPLPAHSLRQLAAFLFDLPASNDLSNNLPIAALSRLADSGHWDAGWWLRLEPVHFRPDRDDLMLFGPEKLELTIEEGAALAASVRDHLAEENLSLEINEPQRWYLPFETPPDCRFADLSVVNGQPIGEAMPTGKDAPIFKSLLNQLQMLLHVHPVNQVRTEQGKLTANGVWFWGGGAFGEINPRQWDAVWTNTALFRGLALLAGNEPARVPDNFNTWFAADPQGEQLIVLPAVDLKALESEWFEPMLLALQEKLLDKVVINLPASKRTFSLTPRRLKYFWRRPLALHKLFPIPAVTSE